jgi:hypothetical protein
VTARPDPRSDPPTPPYGRTPRAPTPPYGLPAGAPTSSATPDATPADRSRTERRPVTPRLARRPAPGPGAATRRGAAQRRLVGLARVLAGGLVVLALAVVAGPWLLDGPGAGGAAVAWHVVGAVVAIVATAVAAHPRTPSTIGVLAALAVPVDVLVVLGTYWWA